MKRLLIAASIIGLAFLPTSVLAAGKSGSSSSGSSYSSGSSRSTSGSSSTGSRSSSGTGSSSSSRGSSSTGSKPSSGSVSRSSTGSKSSTYTPPRVGSTGSGYYGNARYSSNGNYYARNPYGQTIVVHHYVYSDWGMFGYHPFYGYYGCLYCFTGEYAYAPYPVVGNAPTWVLWVTLLFVIMIIAGTLWLVFWR